MEKNRLIRFLATKNRKLKHTSAIDRNDTHYTKTTNFCLYEKCNLAITERHRDKTTTSTTTTTDGQNNNKFICLFKLFIILFVRIAHTLFFSFSFSFIFHSIFILGFFVVC